MNGKKDGRKRVFTLGAKKQLGKTRKRPFQVGEGDPFIHQEAFHLMKDGQMRGVLRLVAVDAARADDRRSAADISA